MGLPNDTILLAFLLALTDLEAHLSNQEKRTLKDLAGQLYHDPQNWERYEPNLLNLIKSNKDLDELYQVAESRINAVDWDTLCNLLPTPEELEEAIPTPKQLTRGNIPTSPKSESNNEIPNVTIRVCEKENPSEAAKNLSFIEKIKQILFPDCN